MCDGDAAGAGSVARTRISDAARSDEHEPFCGRSPRHGRPGRRRASLHLNDALPFIEQTEGRTLSLQVGPMRRGLAAAVALAAFPALAFAEPEPHEPDRGL